MKPFDSGVSLFENSAADSADHSRRVGVLPQATNDDSLTSSGSSSPVVQPPNLAAERLSISGAPFDLGMGLPSVNAARKSGNVPPANWAVAQLEAKRGADSSNRSLMDLVEEARDAEEFDEEEVESEEGCQSESIDFPVISTVVSSRIGKLLMLLHPDANHMIFVRNASRVLVNSGMDVEAVKRVFPEVREGLENSVSLSMATMVHKKAMITEEEFVLRMAREADEVKKLGHLDMLEAGEVASVGGARAVLSTRLGDLKSKGIVNLLTDSTVKRVFDCFHLASIVFVCVAPIYYNLGLVRAEPLWVYVLCCIAHVLWLIDIAATAIVLRAEAGPKSPLEFLPPWWYIEIVMALPVDLIAYWYAVTDDLSARPLRTLSHDSAIAVLFFTRLVKLAKLARVTTLFGFSNMDIITPMFVNFFFLAKPILQVISFTVVAVNLVTLCFMHAEVSDVDSVPRSDYLTALVLSLSMMTGAGPGVTLEETGGQTMLLVLVVLYIMIQTTIIGKLSVMIFRTDINSLNLSEMRETLAIVEHFGVPSDVQTEILSYQMHALNDDMSKRLESLMTLPSQIQKEVIAYVKIDAVSGVRLFRGAQQEAKQLLAEALLSAVVPPDTEIVSIGDVGDEMYMLTYGYASVIIVNGMQVAMLTRGDYFGEVALLTQSSIRQATVKSVTYCDLLVLNKIPFLDILDSYPALLDAMEGDMKAKGIDVKTVDVHELRLHYEQATTTGAGSPLAPKSPPPPISLTPVPSDEHSQSTGTPAPSPVAHKRPAAPPLAPVTATKVEVTSNLFLGAKLARGNRPHNKALEVFDEPRKYSEMTDDWDDERKSSSRQSMPAAGVLARNESTMSDFRRFSRDSQASTGNYILPGAIDPTRLRNVPTVRIMANLPHPHGVPSPHQHSRHQLPGSPVLLGQQSSGAFGSLRRLSSARRRQSSVRRRSSARNVLLDSARSFISDDDAAAQRGEVLQLQTHVRSTEDRVRTLTSQMVDLQQLLVDHMLQTAAPLEGIEVAVSSPVFHEEVTSRGSFGTKPPLKPSFGDLGSPVVSIDEEHLLPPS